MAVFCVTIFLCTIMLRVYSKCLPSQSTCEYVFNVEKQMTMTWQDSPVKAFNGALYKTFKASSLPSNQTFEGVPVDDVITMDGVARSVTVVNRRIPGTPIIAYEGQTLIVLVNNRLLNEAISIHWHGMHQRKTPFMDGVGFLTQCPIGPGQSFEYKFKAYPAGTFFYHSHMDGQRVDGLFGALIIKPKVPRYNAEEFIIHVGDWFHSSGSELDIKMRSGYFKNQPGYSQPKTLDGIYFAPTTFESAHIEGRGRYRDPITGKWSEAPLKQYVVDKGKQYHFRVIGTGMIFPLRVSIDDHILIAISSDGFDFQPKGFESIIVNPGERYDFLIQANRPVRDYWIRVESMEVGFPHNYAKAILRYDGRSRAEPTTEKVKCASHQPCNVLNCQFKYFPENEHTNCVTIDQLEGVNEATPILSQDDPADIFQNYILVPKLTSVNGKVFIHTPISAIAKGKQQSLSCEKPECGIDKVCSCYHEVVIPHNKTIQMVWTNHGPGATRHHPIHLHGHSFHVMKMGFGEYNRTTGQLIAGNHDIECIGEKCHMTKWRNQDYIRNRGSILGLKTNNTPQKDTLMLPAGGYAVIRFRSDNPGKWLLHCHIEFHAMQGMSVVVNEAPKEQMKGSPVCQNTQLHLDSSIRDKAEDGDSKKTKNDRSKGLSLEWVYTLLFVIIAETFLVLLLIGYIYRKKKAEGAHMINEET